MNKLYTIGYQKLRGVYSLLNLVVPLDATLVDIRYVPWSHDERWREESLLKTMCNLQFGGLSCRYVHIKELGNVNYKSGGPIELMHAEVGIARLEENLKVKACILLCQCPDFEKCHRKVVADLAERWIEGCEVEHLVVSQYGQAVRAAEVVEAVAEAAEKVAMLEKRSQPQQGQNQMSMF